LRETLHERFIRFRRHGSPFQVAMMHEPKTSRPHLTWLVGSNHPAITHNRIRTKNLAGSGSLRGIAASIFQNRSAKSSSGTVLLFAMIE